MLFRQGVPPHATYLFKHALVQDAAYGTLLREPRRALHARIAETLESQFAEIAERQPELLARHCTDAGLIEKAAGLWGKAGQQSLARSALVEAVAQLTRALDQIAALPATSDVASRADQASGRAHNPTHPCQRVCSTGNQGGCGTGASTDRSKLKRSESLPKTRLLLFSVLYGFWVANYVAFNGEVSRELAAQFLALAEKQRATVPLMVGHRLMGTSLMSTGDIAPGRAHYDQALALYDPAAHRPLATRFGQDVGVAILCYRSRDLWLLGYPEAALADAEHALKDAREIGQAGTLMYALGHLPLTHILMRK